ncbi:pantothenate transporter [Byssothecium circinans]|uniref:Pantothenate transporter n=1 Tax=Byssothecium circinans TaxID=147558 RepID=A0A6A5TM28_9PLEO|nr:pantothenate transporter [Byssothecium circinans]
MASRTKSVAVIGAGISGVVAAAHLKREGIDVTVFERSSAAGGRRAFDKRQPIEPVYPSILPSKGERKYNESELTEAAQEAELRRLYHAPPGPCYIGLMNNVGTRLLEMTLNPFPSGTPDFVSHSVLGEYIRDTARKTDIDELIRYDTEVTNLNKSGDKWVLEAVTLKSGPSGTVSLATSSLSFDSIVVANGHYHAPRVPDIPNLAAWKQHWPSRIQHSKGYREPSPFKNYNVLLIGASVSATDIARELAPFANTIYQSHRNGAFDLPASLLPENAVRVPEVVSFDDITEDVNAKTLNRSEPLPLTITLKTGQKLCNIHSIILCTGYHTTVPFLPRLHSDTTPPSLASNDVLVTDGLQLHNLHKDIFYIPDPSLLFIGAPYFTATFTLFEFQAMFAAKVVAGKVNLPSEQQMRDEYNEKVRKKGYGKEFHSLRGEEEGYVDGLFEWANRELENGGWEERLKGHGQKWKEAKIEQVERMKALWDMQPKPKKWYYYVWDTLDKPKEERWFMFKLDAALLTFASLGYFIKYLDQSNINSAFVSGMKEDLGLYGNQLNYMQTCWTVGYVIGELPSNVILTRFRPSIWIPTMEVTWSVLTFCLSRANTAKQIYVLRFFIGLAESTFYPGMQYIIGSWYKRDELAKRSCIFHTSGAIATMFSGYLMAGVYKLGGKGGFAGWQWLFIVDGVISLPIALAGYFVLPDVPEISKPFYLTEEEVVFAQKRMEAEGRQKRRPYTKEKIKTILTSWHIYALTLLYVFFNNGGAGSAPVFQQFLKASKNPKYTVSEINVYPTITNAVQVVSTLMYAWTSDSILKGARWPPIVFGGAVNIMCYVSLAIWDIPLKWKWACYALSGMGGGLSGLCMAWAHEICTHNNEERAIVIASMNEFAYVLQAWLPLIVWQQVEAPEYRKGFITVSFLSAALIVTAFAIRILSAERIISGKNVQVET